MALLVIKCPNCGEHDSHPQSGKIWRLEQDKKRLAEYGFSPQFECKTCDFQWMQPNATDGEKLRDLHDAMKEFRRTTGKTDVNL